MSTRDEYQRALNVVLKLESVLQEQEVPETRYALLLERANNLIWHKKDIDEVLEIIEKLCDLL